MNANRTFLSAVVLAAGSATRMRGTNKLLLEIDGRPLVRIVIEALRQGGVDELIAVLGHQAERVRAVLPPGVEVVINKEHATGMASSIRCGVQAVCPQAQGVYIALADMPQISPALIAALREPFEKATAPMIVTPIFAGRQGNPVVFSRALFPELLRLSGDRGAKHLLARHEDKVIKVKWRDRSIFADIDTPAAWEQIMSKIA